MKSLLWCFLLISELLFSTLLHAQELSIVPKGKWGSGNYTQLVEINDHYYIQTSAREIDVINPALTGENSLVGQIDLDAYFSIPIHRIEKFKNFLLVITDNKLSIYSISGITTLTAVYSIPFLYGWDSSVAVQGDYIYVVDATNQIFTIKQTENEFNIVDIIQVESDDVNTNIRDGELFVEDTTLYYWYIEFNQNGNSIKLARYNTVDSTLLSVSELNQNDISYYRREVIHLGNERFVFKGSEQLFMVQLIEDELVIVNDFEQKTFGYYLNFAYKNNVLQVFTGYEHYSYEISENNNVTLLAHKNFDGVIEFSSEPIFLNWLGESLIGLNKGSSVIEFSTENNAITGAESLYNQTGNMGTAAIKDDLIYLPRENRIDVVNISDFENLNLSNSLLEKADDLILVNDSVLAIDRRAIANYSITNDGEFQLNIKVNNTYTRDMFVTEDYAFVIDSYTNYSDYKVRRFNISTPYGLYEQSLEVSFPEFDGSNYCPNKSGLIADYLAVFDPCSQNIFLFSNINNNDFKFTKQIKLNREYGVLEFVDDYVYLVGSNGIDILKFNGTYEFEHVSFVETELSTYLTKIEVIDNYVIIIDSDYLYITDVTDPLQPKVISKNRLKKSEFQNAEIQILDGYLVITTEDLGKVQIFELNKAPIANVSVLTVNEDESVTSTDIFTDPEGDALSFTITQEATSGELTIDEKGLLYTPDDNQNGEDSAVIKVKDSHGNFITHEIKFTIVAVNDAPIVESESFYVDEDSSLTTSVSAIDIEQDNITFSIAAAPTYGSAVITDAGELSYIPNKDYYGEDIIAITVTDEHLAASTKNILITVDSVNDAPNADNAEFTFDEDTTMSGVLSASDIDGSHLTYKVSQQPNSGTLTIQNTGEFTFQPHNNFFGEDSFTFSVDDNLGGTSSGIVNLNILPINDAPTLGNNVFSINEDEQLVDTIKFIDVDSSSMTFEITQLPLNGHVELNNDGSFIYTPQENFAGRDEFSIELVDDNHAKVSGDVFIIVSQENDAPMLLTAEFTIDEDNELTGQLEVSDVEAQQVNIELLDDSELQGTVNISEDGSFSYLPSENFYGDTYFTIKVIDEELASAEYKVSIRVVAVDDIPTLVDQNTTISHGSSYTGTFNTNDIDGDTLSYAIVENVKNGTLTLSGSGEYSYQPNVSFSGSDSFTYSATDSNANTVQAKVTFVVQAKPQESKSSSGGGGGSVSYLLLWLFVAMIIYRTFNKRRVDIS